MKPEKRDDPAHILERLLELCVDGVEGYRLASGVVKEPAWLSRALASAASSREAVAMALTSALNELGHMVKPHGTVAGAAHRALLEALKVYSSDAPHAIRQILHECERGERRALEAFSHALGRTLPEHVRAIIQLQFGRLIEASATLRREIATLEDTGASQVQVAPS